MRQIPIAYSTGAYSLAFAVSLTLFWIYFAPLASAPTASYVQLYRSQFEAGSPLSDYFLICVRTLGVAAATAIIAVWGAAVAAAIFSVSGYAPRFAIVGIPLLLPYFIGNSTSGLLVKVLSANFGYEFAYFANRSYGLVYVFLFGLLIWKDGLLIVYGFIPLRQVT